MSAPDSNYVYSPGSVQVYPGGGAAAQALAPTAAKQSLQSSVSGGMLVTQWTPLPGSVSSGGAATKGSFTLSSGTHAKILTTAAVTGCVISYTVVTLGTVTVASSFLSTIDNGVGFTPVASQGTDTSVVNWAILA